MNVIKSNVVQDSLTVLLSKKIITLIMASYKWKAKTTLQQSEKVGGNAFANPISDIFVLDPVI